ncbi:MAG: transcriptional regulator [Myxococcota bacterium]
MSEHGPRERTRTVRQAILDRLRGEGPLSALDVSQVVRIPEKDVASHLEHLDRSLKNTGERLVVEPAECLACGFVFRERARLTTPGSCPRCRQERIAPPVFRVEPD